MCLTIYLTAITSLSLGGHLLVNAEQAADVEEGRKRIADSLDNGEAMKKFAAMLTAQGVAPDTVAKLTMSQEEAIAVLPRANFTRHLNCAKTGTRPKTYLLVK